MRAQCGKTTRTKSKRDEKKEEKFGANKNLGAKRTSHIFLSRENLILTWAYTCARSEIHTIPLSGSAIFRPVIVVSIFQRGRAARANSVLRRPLAATYLVSAFSASRVYIHGTREEMSSMRSRPDSLGAR